MRMRPIKLPIYHLPEGGEKMEEMGLDVPIGECNIMNMLFLNIDAIGPSSYRKSSVVFSGGRSFVCAMTMIALENKLYNECGIGEFDNIKNGNENEKM